MEPGEIYYASDEESVKIQALVERILKAMHGEPAQFAALAAIRMALSIYCLGGAPRFNVEQLISMSLDDVYGNQGKGN